MAVISTHKRGSRLKEVKGPQLCGSQEAKTEARLDRSLCSPAGCSGSTPPCGPPNRFHDPLLSSHGAASLQAQPILSEVTGSSVYQRWQIPPPTAPPPSFLMAPASAPFPHSDNPQSLRPSRPRRSPHFWPLPLAQYLVQSCTPQKEQPFL